LWAQELGISLYGAPGASVMPRWMSHRNGTSAWHIATACGTSAAVASASPPPLADAAHRDPRRTGQLAGGLDGEHGVGEQRVW